jgi:hypothetical protein
MVKFVPLMTMIIVSAMFALALITGGVMFQAQNNAPNPMINDPTIGNLSADLNTNLQASGNNAKTADQSFTNSSIITNTGGVPFMSAIGGVWKVIKVGPMLIYNVFANFLFAKLFGSALGTTITLSIAGIIILITISAVIYWVSRGEGG